MAQFKVKPVNNDDDVFSEEDRRKILDHLADSDNPYDLAISFDFYVTMRFAELSALRWDDLKGNRIHINGHHLLTTERNDDLTFKANHFINTDHVKGHTDEGFRKINLIGGAMACPCLSCRRC